jgi:adenylosuccinate lyase
MKAKHFGVTDAVQLLIVSAELEGLNLSMPGDPHYQPKALRPYLGYDQRVKWQIIVEWFWLVTLAETGFMPKQTAKLLKPGLLMELFATITTTKVTVVEREVTKHDILALLKLMREVLPPPLHRYLHLGATSYDIICSANALQAKYVFHDVFFTKAREVSVLWRRKIETHAATVRIGMTHLQDAIPTTVGRWLAVLHNRFAASTHAARHAVDTIPGKFSGAVGTSASVRVLLSRKEGLQANVMGRLGLSVYPATQITPPEPMQRFYHEILLVSGALANLGEDVRLLQSSPIGELTSASSTSSAMSHKKSNPIAAEQAAGMHASVIGEFTKVMLTMVSDLERDLRWSNVMRAFPAVIVFTFQQLLAVERILKSLDVDIAACKKNFARSGKLVVAEVLHLYFQQQGLPDAHTFVNKMIVPLARERECSLPDAVEHWLASSDDLGRDEKETLLVRKLWKKVPADIVQLFAEPETYIGDALEDAQFEVDNAI